MNADINKLTAIIVDDELFGRENLKTILETYCTEIKIIALADSVVSARNLVELHKPEVVFLDISMPALDGFDFLEEFDDREFLVVFVSAHKEFGIQAIKAGAIDYILKPINIKEIKETVKKLFEVKTKTSKEEILFEPNKLIIPSAHGFTAIQIDEIIRLQAEGCYTKIFLQNKDNILVTKILGDFEEKLSVKNFYRIHKSHIINLKYFKEYNNLDGYKIILTDGSRVELSRRRAPEFIQKIKNIIRSV